MFVDLLNNMYSNKEEMMADLMKNGLDAVDILYSIIHDAENSTWDKDKKYLMEYWNIS